jgi:hypothetical protein
MKTRRVLFAAVLLVFLTSLASVDPATTSGNTATEPWKQEYVDSAALSHVGTHVAIAHHPITGKAYISYYDAENTALKLAYQVTPGAGNCGPENNWQCDFIDSAYNVGQYSSIDVTARIEYGGYITKVGISYYDATKQRLRYAQGFPELGTLSWTISNVDDSPYEYESVGTFSTIKFDVNHDPQIAYHAEVPSLNYGFLKYASYAGPGIGTCLEGGDWDCEFVGHSTTDASYGSYASMDIDMSGYITIAFYANGDVVRAVHEMVAYPSCDNNDWACQTIDFSHDVGRYVSFHGRQSVADATRLVYYDLTAGVIKYAEFVGWDGNCDADGEWSCYVVDVVGKPPGHIGLSLAVDSQGYPIIAYMDASEEMGPANLKIARPAPAYGLEYGNCGDVPPGELFQYWYCSSIDNGNAYVDEADYAAVSVNPVGLATIAYSEFNSYDVEEYLKIARQYVTINLPLIGK